MISDKKKFVSPYSIKNETGYKIEISRSYTKYQISTLSSLMENKFILYNCDLMNFQVEADLEQMFKEIQETDLQNVYMIDFRILSPNNSFDKVNNINLDRIKTKRHLLKGENLNEEELFFFYIFIIINIRF